MTAREFVSKLQHAKKAPSGWLARCPAHNDRNPSLSIGEKDGKILLKCHAGCSTDSIVAAVGLQMSDLFTESPKPQRQIVATYDYTDESGVLLFQVVRFDPKDFRQRRPDNKGGSVWHLDCEKSKGCKWNPKLQPVRSVLYNLPGVVKARSVLILEGEKE